MKKFTVPEHGFYGFLHIPAVDLFPGKAVIVTGGSEGNENIPTKLGQKFAENGLTALGLCYWNVPGLPEELIEVPVESAERAALWLKENGFQKIAMYGISKGGEYTLLAASLIPDITCAVALSPLQYVLAGITGSKSIAKKGFADRSSYTWRGSPLPFVPGKMHKAGVWRRLLTQRQLDMRFMYEAAISGAPKNAAIRVENIGGPILLIHPAHDTMWPSDAACKDIERRLKEKEFPYPVKRLEYDYASHIIVPLETSSQRAFCVERKYPAKCRESREDAFRRTLDFLCGWQ